MCEKDPPEHFFYIFVVKFWEKSWICQLISSILLEKYFQIIHIIFFPNINSLFLKKSYFLWKIAPFNYPGTLWVIEPGFGPGPGNGKFQKTGSGPGTRVIHYPVQHYSGG